MFSPFVKLTSLSVCGKERLQVLVVRCNSSLIT